MTILGKNAFDNASRCIELGAQTCRWLGNLAVTGTISSETGGVLLANNTWLQSENAAGTSQLNLLKADASNNTVLNALTGKAVRLQINEVTKLSLVAAGVTVTGTTDVTGIVTGAAYHLSDGSDKNYNIEAYAAGTAYTLTNSSAALTFGTTQPAITINKAGIYLLFGRVNLKYNAATFAAATAVTLKLRRTNNTAADISNSTTVVTTAIITTLTYTFATVNLAPVLYTTSNTDDAVTIFGDVAVVPSAGSLDAIEASIVAVRISAT